jgi:hypothetical protein
VAKARALSLGAGTASSNVRCANTGPSSYEHVTFNHGGRGFESLRAHHIEIIK